MNGASQQVMLKAVDDGNTNLLIRPLVNRVGIIVL